MEMTNMNRRKKETLIFDFFELQRKNGIHVMIDGKRLQVIRRFPKAYKVNGEFQLSIDAYDRSTFGGPVELGNNKSGKAESLMKDTGFIGHS